MADDNKKTTTTTPTQPTQPTVPAAGQYGATTTSSVPTSTPTPASGGGSKISPDLQSGVLVEDGGATYQYAIGVKGRKVFDENGNLIKYEGYKYTRYQNGKYGAMPTQVEPKYFSGDEDKIYNLSVENLSSLQKAMNAVGLLGDKYAPGVADNATRAAYVNLLEVANGYGEDTDAAIMRLASVGAGTGKGKLDQYRVSSELDIKNVINRVSQQAIGRKLGEGDLNRLAKMYRELEKQAGLAAASTTLQQVESAPSPEAFAESQLGKMFPTETNARQFGSYLEKIKERYQL
jgi:hypothetical protein